MKTDSIFQGIFGSAISLMIGIVTPYPGWLFVIYIADVLESKGTYIELVGEPAGITPGAVIVSILYLLPLLVISYILIKKPKYKVLGIALGISSTVISFFVFALVSSIIWF